MFNLSPFTLRFVFFLLFTIKCLCACLWVVVLCLFWAFVSSLSLVRRVVLRRWLLLLTRSLSTSFYLIFLQPK